MQSANHPEESSRAAALHALGLTAPSLGPALGDLLRVAACALEAPAAIFAVLEGGSVRFPARIGIALASVPREGAPCAEPLRPGDVLVVPDLLADPRFSAHALAEAGFRFYAGVPVIAPGGQPVGTVAVLDRAPRHAAVLPARLDSLEALARQVVTIAQLRARDAELMTLRELTEANTDLDRLAAFQRAIVDCAGLAIIASDRDGLVRSFNPAAERLTGFAAGELIGQPMERLFDPGELALLASRTSLELGRPVPPAEALLGRTRYGEVDMREWTLVGKEGGAVPVQLTLTALRDASGVTGYLGIAEDISERREVERIKDEFVSTVSHELRTPLTAIRGALGLLQGGMVGELPEVAREMISIALSNSQRLIRLINDILDVEKIEAGKLTLNPVEIDPQELVSTALREVGAVAGAASIALRAQVETHGPLQADRDRLQQVIINLVSNAIKFSPPNGVVRLHVTQPSGAGGSFRFAVADQGPGIPPEKVRKLFRQFQQLDASDTRARGGTGLGLAISRGIVEEHRGRIWVESEPGLGSTFYFEVPPRFSATLAAPAD